MEKMKKKISFIIPVHNSEQYLEECINSVNSVACKKIEKEVIVIDDCSDGNCEQIVRRYQDVKFIKFEENRSQFQARSAGIAAATGDYICFLDSDDFYRICDFERLILDFERDEDVDCLIFHVVTGGVVENKFIDCNKSLSGWNEIIEALEKHELKWNLCNKIFKTSIMKKAIVEMNAGNVYLNMAEDLLLFIGYCLNCKKIKRSKSNTTYYYRENNASETRNKIIGKEKVRRHIESYRQVRDILLNYCRAKKKLKEEQIYNLDRMYFWNLTWYYKEFLIWRSLDFRSQFLFDLLKAFNLELASDFLISSDMECVAAACVSRSKKEKGKIEKLIICVNSLGGGGTERVAVNVANMLANRGYDVCMVTQQIGKHEYVLDARIKRYMIDPAGAQRYISFSKIFEKVSPDCVIFVDYYKIQTMKDILWTKINNYRVIAMEHNMFLAPVYTDFMSLLYARDCAYRTVDALVCLTEMDRVVWQGNGINNVFMIPNANTFQLISAEHKKNEKRNSLIFIGRLCRDKGIQFLPRLLRLLKSARPDVKLFLVGSFSELEGQKEFWKEIKREGVEEVIEFVGQIDNVAEYYKKAAVHIMLSKFEGFPMVMNEAKSFGLPSVIFDMKYLTVATENDGCIQVAYGDVDSMAEVIIRLMNDSAYYDSMSDSARASIARFTESDVFGYWAEMFKKIETSELVRSVTLEEQRIFYHELLKALTYVKKSEYPAGIGYSAYVNELLGIANRLLPIGTLRRKYVKSWITKIMRILGKNDKRKNV